MKSITHHYDPDGTLHADNPSHPGITEADIEFVLRNLAMVTPNHTYAGQKLATGATQGVYPFLTVAYKENQTALFAITAWPPNIATRAAYVSRVNAGGRTLWVPA